MSFGIRFVLRLFRGSLVKFIIFDCIIEYLFKLLKYFRADVLFFESSKLRNDRKELIVIFRICSTW